MKCPKCNFTSFDYLDSCKKCGKDLTEHKEKYNIRSVLFATTTAGTAAAVNAAGEDDFEFDFNEDEGSDETPLTITEALPDTDDDHFGVGEESEGFNFDSDDTFSFDDDEL